MIEERLEIKINKNGSFTIETKGEFGSKCRETLKMFLSLSDRTTLVKVCENTSEYYKRRHFNILSTVPLNMEH